MKKNFVLNSSGITLVEVMMAVSISGGLALTVAKLMENTSQNTKTNEAKSENINLKGLVQNILSNTTACNYTFSPLITQANLTTLAASPSNSVTVPSVKDRVNAIAYSTASTNVNPLTITQLALTNYNSGTSTADLLIQSSFRRSASQVQMVKPIRVPLNFNINNTNPASPVLLGCSTMAVGGEWMLTGNSGTVDGTDYIGTSDDVPLNFRVNAQRAGRIDNSKQNTFFGASAGNALSSYTGNGNVGIGASALQANNTGLYNVAVGINSLRQSSGAHGNVAVGPNTMWLHTTNDYNTAIGYVSMQQSTSSSQNTAVGAISLRQITTGSNNVAVGYGALNMTTTGASNVGIGHQALVANTIGTGNVGLGVYALGANSTGTQNTAIGMEAGSRVVSNIANTYVGFRAGYQTTGAQNTMIGNETGFSNTAGTANVFLGYRAGYSETGSNKLHINNGATATSLIEGDFTSAGRYINVNGKLGIGVSSPTHKIQIGPLTGTTSTNSPDVISLGGTYSTTPGANAKLRLLDAGSVYYGMGVSPSSLDVMSLAGVTFYLNQSGSAYHIKFAQNGSLGVGTLNPTEKLHVVGNILATGTIKTSGGIDSCPSGWGCDGYFWDIRTHGIAYTNIQNMSDRRLKKNIKNLDETFVQKLLKLNPVQYEWKKDQKTGKESRGVHYGFIAQEIEAIWPELVNTANDENKTKSIAGTEIISPLVLAFQYLNAEVSKNKAMFKLMHEGIQQKISVLEEKVKILERENLALKTRLDQIEKSIEMRLRKLEARR